MQCTEMSSAIQQLGMHLCLKNRFKISKGQMTYSKPSQTTYSKPSPFSDNEAEDAVVEPLPIWFCEVREGATKVF